MRPPLSLALLPLLCGAFSLLPMTARAQQQEKKFWDRLDEDMKSAQNAMCGGGKAKEYTGENKGYSGAKVYEGKSAKLKDFYMPQKFNSKEYLTGDYHGSKNFWMGDFKYSAQTATVKDYASGKKLFPTKPSAVKDAPNSQKSYAVSGADPKKYVSRSKLDKFDPQNATPTSDGWQGNLEPMSIDQVRTLLNKNK